MKEKNIILLYDAYLLFRKKEYSEAVLLLEQVISSESSNSDNIIYAYFLLSASYLLTNRFNDAESMLRRIRLIDRTYPPYVHLEAFILLKSSPDLHSALSLYLDRLEQLPGDKYLSRVIRGLRKTGEFSKFQKDALISKYVCIPPPVYKRSFYKSISNSKNKTIKKRNLFSERKFLKISFIILIPVIMLLFYYGIKFIPYIHRTSRKQVELEHIELDALRYDLIDKIKNTKTPVFYYSNQELLEDFSRAKKLIKEERYNEALIIINRIANSNANYRVNERLNFLRKFIDGIEYRKYSNIQVNDVISKPYLYKGVYLTWNGKIANLKRTESKLSFNLLVDYKKDNIFDGVIDVLSQKSYDNINNGDYVSIEAVFVNVLDDNNRIFISAHNISKL